MSSVQLRSFIHRCIIHPSIHPSLPFIHPVWSQTASLPSSLSSSWSPSLSPAWSLALSSWSSLIFAGIPMSDQTRWTHPLPMWSCPHKQKMPLRLKRWQAFHASRSLTPKFHTSDRSSLLLWILFLFMPLSKKKDCLWMFSGNCYTFTNCFVFAYYGYCLSISSARLGLRHDARQIPPLRAFLWMESKPARPRETKRYQACPAHGSIEFIQSGHRCIDTWTLWTLCTLRTGNPTGCWAMSKVGKTLGSWRCKHIQRKFGSSAWNSKLIRWLRTLLKRLARCHWYSSNRAFSP